MGNIICCATNDEEDKEPTVSNREFSNKKQVKAYDEAMESLNNELEGINDQQENLEESNHLEANAEANSQN